MSKLVGKFVTEKLSGKKGIIVKKKKKKYEVRFWIEEDTNWIRLKCPRQQFELSDDVKLKKWYGT